MLGGIEAGLAANAGDGDCAACVSVCWLGGWGGLYANLIMRIVASQFANVSQNFNQMNTAGMCSTHTAACPVLGLIICVYPVFWK